MEEEEEEMEEEEHFARFHVFAPHLAWARRSHCKLHHWCKCDSLTASTTPCSLFACVA